MSHPLRPCGVAHPGFCGLDFGLAECVRGNLVRARGVAPAAPPAKPRVSVAELARRKRH